MKKLLIAFITITLISTVALADADEPSTQDTQLDHEQVMTEFMESFKSNKEMRKLLRKSIREKNEAERILLQEKIAAFFSVRKVSFHYDVGTYDSYSAIVINEWGGDKNQMEYKSNWFNSHRANGGNISFGPGIGASAGYMVSVCVGNDLSWLNGIRAIGVVGLGITTEFVAGSGGACVLLAAAVGLEVHVGYTAYR
jgi:hypothetical protein